MDLQMTRNLKSSDELIDFETHFKLYAGPGAGKTRFLINHVNSIIGKSCRLNLSKKVACITYTNIGVNTIKERLNASSDQVEVSTIHSFLYKHVLKPYIWSISDLYEIPPNKVDGHDNIVPRYSILKDWKENTNQQYITDNIKLTQELSKLEWNLDENLVCKLSIKYGSKLKVRNNSLIEYKKLCWKKGLISHNDVLYLSYEILNRNARVQDIIRAKFPYIIVDEFQDTSPIQAEILKIIGRKESIIGVIGDTAQSIYSFQGAVPAKFEEFTLTNIKCFKIENNHRSTDEIVGVLNYLRNDTNFTQKSLKKNKHGEKPRIIIGEHFQALQKAREIIGSENLYTLTYKNEYSSKMKYGIDTNIETVDLNDLFANDSCDKRRWLITFIVMAIEYALSANFKDAIKYMTKAYRKFDNFDQRDALSNLQRLINNYDKYRQLPIKDFYNNYVYGYHGVGEKITRGKTETYYKTLMYQSVALGLGVVEEDSVFRTIHKSKGDEFNNVFVMIPEQDEKKSLNFVFNRDITNNEDHRVYYVACSRAKENLFLNIPLLSEKSEKKIEKAGFKIVRLE